MPDASEAADLAEAARIAAEPVEDRVERDLGKPARQAYLKGLRLTKEGSVEGAGERGRAAAAALDEASAVLTGVLRETPEDKQRSAGFAEMLLAYGRCLLVYVRRNALSAGVFADGVAEGIDVGKLAKAAVERAQAAAGSEQGAKLVEAAKHLQSMADIQKKDAEAKPAADDDDDDDDDDKKKEDGETKAAPEKDDAAPAKGGSAVAADAVKTEVNGVAAPAKGADAADAADTKKEEEKAPDGDKSAGGDKTVDGDKAADGDRAANGDEPDKEDKAEKEGEKGTDAFPAEKDDAAAKEAALKDAAPKDAAPEDAAPKDAAPKDTAPEDAAPKDTAPEDAAPKDTAPKDAAPKDAAPKDAAPKDAPASDAAEPKKDAEVEADDAKMADADAADDTKKVDADSADDAKKDDAAKEDSAAAGSLTEKKPAGDAPKKDADDASSDVPVEELAWEQLEVSRTLFEALGTPYVSRLSAVHESLGDFLAESDGQDAAAGAEYAKAAACAVRAAGEASRRVADLHHRRHLSLRRAAPADAVTAMQDAIRAFRAFIASGAGDKHDNETAGLLEQDLAVFREGVEEKMGGVSVVGFGKAAAAGGGEEEVVAGGADAVTPGAVTVQPRRRGTVTRVRPSDAEAENGVLQERDAKRRRVDEVKAE